MPKPQRVLVAMSGGVDSSVAAWLLQQSGYECIGATMRLYDTEQPGNDASESPVRACGNAKDIEDARAVAARLGIPHHTLDCRAEFERDVVEDFVRSYERGVTPNPCAVCNRRIKFGLLLEHARELGCDAIATGHYARIRTRESSNGTTYELVKAADASKDQSYFLYSLTQDVLAHVIFPLGELTKEGDVRRIAAELGFSNAQKRDSQGICFVPRNDFASFIERRRGHALPEGKVLDTAGNVLGSHRGAIRYTVGQRKGLGIAAAHPLYVTATDAVANTVTLGEEADLFASSLIADDWVWSAPAHVMASRLDEAQSGTPFQAAAQIRYHQPDQDVSLSWADSDQRGDVDEQRTHGDVDGRHAAGHAGGQHTAGHADGTRRIRIDFARPQRAIAPGQAVVVYEGDVVLGGGTVVCVPRA
ncbi:tRNA 2-thiouridine(34) synthase MnmA [Collinsella sp. An2]|uniref:tRNA 2-thiouridine(34) synthase MnmA n=1 Tax=Collinsella sp. An2 TaxID=1965585 RepID=UPI000B372A12|nr:tRNA 2-thiouridine(34) synthase MnmA [Collinsella sp. An2]OUP09198.1 tRNA 2-thiouridine(34) synthase MnmA [Collinsella sp. An2]